MFLSPFSSEFLYFRFNVVLMLKFANEFVIKSTQFVNENVLNKGITNKIYSKISPY